MYSIGRMGFIWVAVKELTLSYQNILRYIANQEVSELW